MAESIADIAERRFIEALENAGARDPRQYYRDQLRLLKEENQDGFRRGTAYYRDELLPRVAESGSDPIAEWLDYGRYLIGLRCQGEAVQIDETGRSNPYQKPVSPKHLVLHLPSAPREAAIPVGIPPELSDAQRAAFDLLVKQTVNY